MEYTLNCLVLGAEDTFPVKIKGAQSVGELKDEIKKKKEPRFNGLAADELTLYQINVDISDDNDIGDIMHEVSQPGYVFNPKRKLQAARKLARVFRGTGPPDDTVHILVVPPQSKSIDR